MQFVFFSAYVAVSVFSVCMKSGSVIYRLWQLIIIHVKDNDHAGGSADYFHNKAHGLISCKLNICLKHLTLTNNKRRLKRRGEKSNPVTREDKLYCQE